MNLLAQALPAQVIRDVMDWANPIGGMGSDMINEFFMMNPLDFTFPNWKKIQSS